LLHLEAHLPLIYQVAVVTRGPFLDDACALGKVTGSIYLSNTANSSGDNSANKLVVNTSAPFF
jgi:hypothetical protein